MTQSGNMPNRNEMGIFFDVEKWANKEERLRKFMDF